MKKHNVIHKIVSISSFKEFGRRFLISAAICFCVVFNTFGTPICIKYYFGNSVGPDPFFPIININWTDWYLDNYPDACKLLEAGNENSLVCRFDDPNEACAAYAKEKHHWDTKNNASLMPPQPAPPTYFEQKIKGLKPPNSANTLYPNLVCYVNKKGGSMLYQTGMSQEFVDPQEICSLNVEGPYRYCSDFNPSLSENPKLKQLSYGMVAGTYFNKTGQKALIKTLNEARNGGLKSDILESAYKALDSGYAATPCKNVSASGPCSLEVHHIIPRVDKNGCPCGTNSFKNAIYIPQQLNQRIATNAQRSQWLIQVMNANPIAPPYSDGKRCKAPTKASNLFNLLLSRKYPFLDFDSVFAEASN